MVVTVSSRFVLLLLYNPLLLLLYLLFTDVSVQIAGGLIQVPLQCMEVFPLGLWGYLYELEFHQQCCGHV